MNINLSRIQTQLRHKQCKAAAISTQEDSENDKIDKNLIRYIQKIIHSLTVYFLPISVIQIPGGLDSFSYNYYDIDANKGEEKGMGIINSTNSESEIDAFSDKRVMECGENLPKDALLFLHVLYNKNILAATFLNSDVAGTVRHTCFSREGRSLRVSLLQHLTRSVGVWRAMYFLSFNSEYLNGRNGKNILFNITDTNNSSVTSHNGDEIASKYSNDNGNERSNEMIMTEDNWDTIQQQQRSFKQQCLLSTSNYSSDLFSTRIGVLNPFEIFGLNFVKNESKGILSLLKDCDQLYDVGMINRENLEVQIKRWEEAFRRQKDDENLNNNENKKNYFSAKNLVWYSDVVSSLGLPRDVDGQKAAHDCSNRSINDNYNSTNNNHSKTDTDQQSSNSVNDISIKSVEKRVMIDLRNHWRRWLQQVKTSKDNQPNYEIEKETLEPSKSMIRPSESVGTQIDIIHDALVSIIAVITSCLCEYDSIECGWRTGVSGVGYTNEFKLKGRIDTVKQLSRELSLSWFFQISDTSEKVPPPPSLLIFQGNFVPKIYVVSGNFFHFI